MPVKVSAEIKRLLKEKDRGIKSGVQAMNGIMEDLHSQIMDRIGRAALGSWEAYRLKQLANELERVTADFGRQAQDELSSQLDTMWDRGGALVDSALKAGEINVSMFHISRSSLDALKSYSSGYLEKMFGDAWFDVKGEINLGILGAKTPQQVADAIGVTMRKGKFANYAERARTITQTEMGRTFSAATQDRMEVAATHVDGLEKQWIHAGHPLVARPTHVAANGQHVPVNQSFIVGGAPIMFPRDPAAPVAETIHCG